MSDTADLTTAKEVLLDEAIGLTIFLGPLADQEEPDELGGSAIAFLQGPALEHAREVAGYVGPFWNEYRFDDEDDPTCQAWALLAHLVAIAPHVLAGLKFGDPVSRVRALSEAIRIAHDLAEDVAYVIRRKGGSPEHGAEVPAHA